MSEITVIIPIYKVRAYIEASVKSLCEQTYKDFDVILVDDGGNDGSVPVAQEILERASIRHKVCAVYDRAGKAKNCGLSAARNLGLQAAQGRWLICLDADDYFHPSMFQLYRSAMESYPRADFIFCDYLYVTTESKISYPPISPTVREISLPALARAFFERKIPVVVPTILLRAEHVREKKLLYPEDCRYSEDFYYIWMLLMQSELQGVHIENKLYYYLLHENSIMSSSSFEKIMTGYRKTQQLEEQIEETPPSWDFDTQLIHPRWVLGTTHSAARMLTYGEYAELNRQMGTRKRLRMLLRKSGNLKVCMASLAYLLAPRVYYQYMKRR